MFPKNSQRFSTNQNAIFVSADQSECDLVSADQSECDLCFCRPIRMRAFHPFRPIRIRPCFCRPIRMRAFHPFRPIMAPEASPALPENATF